MRVWGVAVSLISPSKVLHCDGTTPSFISFSSRSSTSLRPGSLSPSSPFSTCSCDTANYQLSGLCVVCELLVQELLSPFAGDFVCTSSPCPCSPFHRASPLFTRTGFQRHQSSSRSCIGNWCLFLHSQVI